MAENQQVHSVFAEFWRPGSPALRTRGGFEAGFWFRTVKAAAGGTLTVVLVPLRRHTLSRRRIIPLPQWKANPETDPDALFSKDQLVLALYPQTTCFYRALIHTPPHRVSRAAIMARSRLKLNCSPL